MKVLFSDIDGVCNCASTPGSCHQKLDTAMLARLDDVLTRTGAYVVISSCWRCGDRGKTVARQLAQAGFRHPERIIDETPWHPSAIRGYEIGEWLYAHPEVQTFAILDDDSDMGSLRSHLVQTTWSRGLQDEHVEHLVRALGEATRLDQAYDQLLHYEPESDALQGDSTAQDSE